MFSNSSICTKRLPSCTAESMNVRGSFRVCVSIESVINRYLMNRYAKSIDNLAHYISVLVHGAHYCDVALWHVKTIVGFELDQTLFSSYPMTKKKKAVWPSKINLHLCLPVIMPIVFPQPQPPFLCWDGLNLFCYQYACMAMQLCSNVLFSPLYVNYSSTWASNRQVLLKALRNNLWNNHPLHQLWKGLVQFSVNCGVLEHQNLPKA